MRQVELAELCALRGTRPPVHVAEELTGGGQQAWIEHNGQIDVLRITRAGKLILTK